MNDKCKKKILKALYKEWMSRDKVSAVDIISWLNNPENNLELYAGIMNALYNSKYYRYYIPFRAFIYEHIYPRKKIIEG